MNKLFFIFLFIFFSITVLSQDLILRKNHDIIECKISKIDTTYAYFTTLINAKKVKTKIPVANISSYKWNNKIYTLQPNTTANKNLTTNTSNTAPDLNHYKALTKKYPFIKNRSSNFICFFNSDTILEIKNIEFKHPFLGYSYFLADDKKITPSFVKFYKDETGFYANLIDITNGFNSGFSICESRGKINLFSKTEYGNSMMVGGASPTGIYGPTFNGGFGYSYPAPMLPYTKYYYCKGFGDLTKVSYKNLKHDLADNASSLLFLEVYKKLEQQGRLINIAGYAIIGITSISLINHMNHELENTNETYSNQPPDYLASHSLAFLGGMALIFTKHFYFDMHKKPEALKKAIDTYNK